MMPPVPPAAPPSRRPTGYVRRFTLFLAGCYYSERTMPVVSAARQTKTIANAFCDVSSMWNYRHKGPHNTEPRKATEHLQLTDHPLIFTTRQDGPREMMVSHWFL